MKGEIPLPVHASVPFCPSVTWHIPYPRNQNDWSSQEHGELFWAPTSETTCRICYGKSPMLGCKNQLFSNVLSYGSCLHHLQKFSLLEELDLGCLCRGAACGEGKAESSPFLPSAHIGVYTYRQAIEVSHPFHNTMTVNFIPGHYLSRCQRIKLYPH